MNAAPPIAALARLVLIAAVVAFAWLAGGESVGEPDALAAPYFPVREALNTHPDEPVARPGEFIVRFKQGTPAAMRRAALTASGASLVRDLRLPGYSLVRVPPGQEQAYERRLTGAGEVLSVEPNLLRWAAFTPNDPGFPFQWHFAKIGLPTAWDKTSGAGVTVAVLDTGVAYENCSAAVCGANYTKAPDFGGTVFVSPGDEVHGDAHPNDENGHGTHVASTVAEATNNALGAAGVAFGAQIMPVQVLATNGQGFVADEIDGIMWAVNHGADIISMSLGGPGGIAAEQAAVDAAVNSGVLVVVAAGNGGMDGVGDPVLDCPACYPSSVSVGATRFDQARSPYSNFGTGVKGHTLDIMAPGGDLTVDQNGDGFGDGVLQQTFGHFCGVPGPPDFSSFVLCFVNGTSMATPHISGVAALVLSVDPALPPAQVRAALTSTATDLGPAGYDLEFGNGEVNAAATVAAVQVDTDNDGCTDFRETAAKPFAAVGGGRDPNLFWDFFDTPDAANVRDRAIAISDIFRVVSRFGSSGDPSGPPLLPPPPAPAYHTAFDRDAPSPGANAWNLNPPNGAIAISDIFFAVRQFGHTCVM